MKDNVSVRILYDNLPSSKKIADPRIGDGEWDYPFRELATSVIMPDAKSAVRDPATIIGVIL